MKCTHCKKEIVLVPSAAERAKKDISGRPASYYTSLFTMHADCQLELRRQETADLCELLRAKEIWYERTRWKVPCESPTGLTQEEADAYSASDEAKYRREDFAKAMRMTE